jgi:hypothetical protein
MRRQRGEIDVGIEAAIVETYALSSVISRPPRDIHTPVCHLHCFLPPSCVHVRAKPLLGREEASSDVARPNGATVRLLDCKRAGL